MKKYHEFQSANNDQNSKLKFARHPKLKMQHKTKIVNLYEAQTENLKDSPAEKSHAKKIFHNKDLAIATSNL